MSMKKKIVSVSGVFIVGVLVGSALMYNNSFYHKVNDVLGRGATQNSIASAGNVNGMMSVNVNSMDLETALMAVQQQRSGQMDQQLKNQITAVQARNDQIAKLNAYLNKQREVAAQFPSNAQSTDKTNGNQQEAIREEMKKVGISEEPPKTKGELDALISKTKGQIDSLSNTQQMDMLRLQSLSNKRNEAFDVMSNFVKKMQDSRSSIIGNMR